jgi:selenophosphate synthase
MNAPEKPAESRPTSLSHGGGCGCKIAPGLLSEILKGTAALHINLLSTQTSGGLLVACSPDALDALPATFQRHGFGCAAVVVRVAAATEAPRLRVTA